MVMVLRRGRSRSNPVTARRRLGTWELSLTGDPDRHRPHVHATAVTPCCEIIAEQGPGLPEWVICVPGLCSPTRRNTPLTQQQSEQRGELTVQAGDDELRGRLDDAGGEAAGVEEC